MHPEPGAPQKHSEPIRIAWISAGATVVAALIALGGAFIAANNKSIISGLGGQPSVTVSVSPSPFASPSEVAAPVSPTNKPPAGYLVDMNWQDYTNNGPGNLVTGLALVEGKRYRKSFTTGQCYVNKVVIKLPSSSFIDLKGAVGLPDGNVQGKPMSTVQISTTPDLTSNTDPNWTVIDSISISQHSPVKAFNESLPAGTLGIRLQTIAQGCVPDIVWGDPEVS